MAKAITAVPPTMLTSTITQATGNWTTETKMEATTGMMVAAWLLTQLINTRMNLCPDKHLICTMTAMVTG